MARKYHLCAVSYADSVDSLREEGSLRMGALVSESGPRTPYLPIDTLAGELQMFPNL